VARAEKRKSCLRLDFFAPLRLCEQKEERSERQEPRSERQEARDKNQEARAEKQEPRSERQEERGLSLVSCLLTAGRILASWFYFSNSYRPKIGEDYPSIAA
jgi:hypothetical protein